MERRIDTSAGQAAKWVGVLAVAAVSAALWSTLGIAIDAIAFGVFFVRELTKRAVPPNGRLAFDVVAVGLILGVAGQQFWGGVTALSDGRLTLGIGFFAMGLAHVLIGLLIIANTRTAVRLSVIGVGLSAGAVALQMLDDHTAAGLAGIAAGLALIVYGLMSILRVAEPGNQQR